MAYNLGNSNISDVLAASLKRKEQLEEMDVTGGTTHGSHQKNTNDDLDGRRMAGGVFMGKGAEGEFANMARDPMNQGYLDSWMQGFVNGGFNDDIFPPPPPPPVIAPEVPA